MKRRIDAFSISVLLFMLVLSLDFGSFDAVATIAAPIVATLVAFLLANAGAENKIDALTVARRLTLRREGLSLTLLVAAPTVTVILFISYLTSLVLGALGAVGAPVENEPIARMLLTRALIPTISEEMLFRLVPLVIVAPYSKRSALILSTLLFAFVHCNFFQIPFALAAGLVFMMLDLAFESILPSLILHFLNNTASVIWIKVGENSTYAAIFFGVLGVLCAASLVVVYARRRRIFSLMRESLSRGERAGRECIAIPAAVMALSTLSAVMNII